MTGYTYNLSGALLTETYPSGRVVKNTIADNGDLSQVETKPSGGSYTNRASNFVYTAAGAVSSMQLGNSKYENTVFNSRLQPTQIGLGTTTTGTSLLKLEYDYGTTANNGNVQSQTITVPTVGANTGFVAVQGYSYDSLNRLQSATENLTPSGGSSTQTWKQEFSYDRYGNRNFVTGTGHTDTLGTCTTMCNPTFSATTNKITSSGYTYDASGNTTADPLSRTFVYDGENKQTNVSNVGGRIGIYSYDGDGKRVKKVDATGTTLFFYDAMGRVVEESFAAVPICERLQRGQMCGAPEPTTTSYIYAGSRLLTTEVSSVTTYMTADTLGTPRINTNGPGAVVARHDYHPFGEEIATAQRTSGVGYSGDGVRKKFTGYERDGETDLDFAQARYHSYNLGRFSSPDPLLLSARLDIPQTWNRYSYVVNNPLALVDNDGLYPSPAYNCSATVKACLNDEQRRILDASAKNFGTKTGEALYTDLNEKQQNAFVNITDKLGSLKTDTGATLLSLVTNVTVFGKDRIISTVSSDLQAHLKNSDQFKTVPAGDHKPFNAVSYKDTGPTFGNVQFSLNKDWNGADIDMDIGNIVSGDLAGPVVHGFEVLYNKTIGKLFDRKTNQNTVRRILLADPSVQTITPSPDAKYNRGQK